MTGQPFKPRGNAMTVNIDVSASSQNVLVATTAGAGVVRIYNAGSAPVWIEFVSTSSGAAAVATGMPIAPGSVEVLTATTRATDPLYVAAIAAAATGKIYFTPGEGI